jgi:hypothetical protein
MSEQQTTSACPHPEAVGTRWGDPTSEERKAELQGYLDRWEAEQDHGERKGPFDGGPGRDPVQLTGADVFWVATHDPRTADELPSRLHIEGAFLKRAHLEKASLAGAYLENTFLEEAYLDNAVLVGTHLEDAELSRAHLQGAHLGGAYLGDAALVDAYMERASLIDAHLEGARLQGAHLEDANLRGTWMDKATALDGVHLNRVSFNQATFDNTNLSVVEWKNVPVLGDELTAQSAKDKYGKRKSRQQRIADYQAAVRTYRRLAVALQANGLSTESANYLYRASIMERRLARHERRVGAYFFSVLLAVLAGYGYRLGRIVVAYITVVAAFAIAFLAARYFSGTLIDWEQVGEATQISLNAIHGRVFFAQLTLDSIQAWIATIESVVGIVIEGVFVAMLIQRFFGR